MTWVDWVILCSAIIIVIVVFSVAFYLCECFGHRIVPTIDSWLDFLRTKKDRLIRKQRRQWYSDLIKLSPASWQKVPGTEKAWPTFEAWRNGVLVAKLKVERFKDVERYEDLVVCSIPVETIVRRLITLSLSDGHLVTGCCPYCPVVNHSCQLVDWLYKDLLHHKYSIPFKQEVIEP